MFGAKVKVITNLPPFGMTLADRTQVKKMTIAAFDVHYSEGRLASAAAVVFNGYEDHTPSTVQFLAHRHPDFLQQVRFL